jgi:RNA polymerase sigma-70 factor, ECF subfamily
MHDEPVRVRQWSDAVEATYLEVAPRLWRALLAHTGDPDIATDAAAEAFAQLLRRGGEVRAMDRWVWKVAFRIAAGELKDRRIRSRPLAEGSYEMSDEAVAMANLLRQLPGKQRAAIVLHYFADLPTATIADILGMSGATVRVHLSRGRKRLRRLLEEEDHE